MGAPALDGQPHHSDTRGRKHRRASERPLGRRAAVLKRNKHSHEPLDDEPLSPSPLSPSPPSSPLHALSLGAPAPAGTQMASMHALDTQAHAAAADEPAQSGNNTPIWPGPPTPRAKAFSRSNSGIFGAIAGSASPRRSQPASASQSPAGSRPGTPTSTAGFLQTIFDAASRMVSAPKNIAGVDRKDLPPLPSAFHTEEGQAQPGMAPNIHGHHPPLPSKLIIAPVKNAVAPITNSGNLPNNKGLAAVQAIVQGAAALSSPVAPPVVQTGISSADALAAAPSAPSATTPTVLVNGGSGGELTESPTSENFASPTDDSLSPARVAEKHRRRRRNPNARSPISPGPPPDSEIDTPTRVRTSQEVLEAKLDGNAVGIQEPGVEVAVSPQDGVVLRWQSGDDLFLLSENDAKDDANLPPLPSPLPPLTTPILWTVRQQQGYRKPPGHPLNVPTMQRMPLHQKCEDVHAPPLPPDSTHSDSASGVHPLNHNAYHLFVLADGHGGHGAAEWFVPRIREQVEELLRREDWEFSVEAQRCKFGEHITSIFSELDREYCDLKVRFPVKRGVLHLADLLLCDNRSRNSRHGSASARAL